MSNDLLIRYLSKGDKEFAFNFTISDMHEVLVFTNDRLRGLSDYTVYFTSNQPGGRVVFREAVGSKITPVLVTIIKKSPLARTTEFTNFATFRAESLNKELNNFLDIISSLTVRAENAILKSNLEVPNRIILLPKSLAGKGMFWGENGELLNTDLNLNEVLNELAANNPGNPSSFIDAEKIIVNTTSLYVKEKNLQSFLTVLDKTNQATSSLPPKVATLTATTATLSTQLDTVQNNLETITETANSAFNLANKLQPELQDLQYKVDNLPRGNTVGIDPSFGLLKLPLDSLTKKTGFFSCVIPWTLNIVNINPDNPLSFNLLLENKVEGFNLTDIKKDFVFDFIRLSGRTGGRYYLSFAVIDKQVVGAGAKSKPYFGIKKPCSQQLEAYGCDSASDYFIIPEQTFYTQEMPNPYTKTPRIYVGYVDINDQGTVNNPDTDIVYFAPGKYYEYFIDIAANHEYVIPNFLGCTAISLKAELMVEDEGIRYLIPATNQGKFNNANANVLEMGINFAYNVDTIRINTAKSGVLGYYKGSNLLVKTEGTLKLTLIRDF